MLTIFLAYFLVSVTGASAPAPAPSPSAASALRDSRDAIVAPEVFPATAALALAHHVGDSSGRIVLSLRTSDTVFRTPVLALSTKRASVEIGRLRSSVTLLQQYLHLPTGASPGAGGSDLPRLNLRDAIENDPAFRRGAKPMGRDIPAPAPAPAFRCPPQAWTAAFGYPDEIIAAVNDTDLVSVWRLTSAGQNEDECLRLAENAENFDGPSRPGRFSPPPAIHEQSDASIQYDFPASLEIFLPMISRILEDSWMVERIGQADIVWFGVNFTGMEMRWTAFAPRYVVFRLAFGFGASPRTYCEVYPTRINMVADIGKNSVSAVIESNMPLKLDAKSLREWLTRLPSPLSAITATAPLRPSR